MARFKRKPPVVEAIQFKDRQTLEALTEPRWLVEALDTSRNQEAAIKFDPTKPVLYVRSDRGSAGGRAEIGDFIVRDSCGSIHTMRPEEFNREYDPA